MRTTLRILLTGLPLAFTAATASAADLGARYAPPAPVPVYTAPVAEGWYLRGDVGGSVFRDKGKWHESEMDDTSTDYLFNGWTSRDWKPSATVGVGIGYQFNSYLRGDITGEYRTQSKVIGNQAMLQGTDPAAPGAFYTAHDTAKIDSWVFLANLYADIGHYNGLTPYVGAGIGAAINRFSDGYQESGGAGTGSYGTYKDASKTNLAAALYAGLSYDITSQFTIDAGYRWLWLGKATSGNKTCYNPANTDPTAGCIDTGTATTEKWEMKDLMSHDIRVGLRYKFYDDAPARVPVMAKN